MVMLLVAGYTVLMHDLASAVILGVAVSALVFAWKHATHIFADEKAQRIWQQDLPAAWPPLLCLRQPLQAVV